MQTIRFFVERFGRVLRFFEGVALKLSALILLSLVVLINVEVFGRYLFSYSTRIADEYGGYFYAWIVLLGGVHLLRSDRYLMMTSVLDRMSGRIRNAIYLSAALVGLSLCIVCFISVFGLVKLSYLLGTRSTQPSGTPLVYVQIAMPIGYALLCAAYLEEIVRRSIGLPPRRADDDATTYGVGDAS
jgi:TRAP-type C4-dicarboxylate transport system permease small subunit